MLIVKYIGFGKTRIIEAEKVTYETLDHLGTNQTLINQAGGCDIPIVRAQLRIGDERDFSMMVVPSDFQFSRNDPEPSTSYCHTVIVENSNGKTSDIIRGGSYKHHPGRQNKDGG